jgi:hypothetical protein
MRIFLGAAALALACTCPKPTPIAPSEPVVEQPAPPAEAEPAPAGDDSPASVEPAAKPKLDNAVYGSPCAAGGVCPKGLTCLQYFGIAGARGPQFATCELGCGEGLANPEGIVCPAGLSCQTIADGPGSVCRAN